jgi:hypothetical protein
MHSSIFIVIFLMLYNTAISQKRGGIEQYYYGGQKGISAVVPKIYYQNKKNWYAEVRYNYDELETISFNAGKTFSKENIVAYAVTPIAGIITGKLNGASLGLNVQSEYKKVFFSAESQYTFSINSRDAEYFYNWSELGYDISEAVYTGLAMQLTHLYKTTNEWEPGIVVGLSFNKFTFPLYLFNPASANRYFVLGINIEWGND